MSLLHYLSYIAILAVFAFITLSLASGLLYVSELIEEHSRVSKIVGQRGIYSIIGLHALLYISDSLPLQQTIFSILCHVVYLQNFSASWPLISLSSWSFITSCVLVIADHFSWFFYFSRITQDARHASHLRYSSAPIPGFVDIATFFGVCVWLAPLFLFLSLSANDNALPLSSSIGLDSEPSTPTKPSHGPAVHTSLFKKIFSGLPTWSRRVDSSEGIIAPRSPSVPPRTPTMMRSPSMPTTPGSPTTSRVYGGETLLSPNFRLSGPPPSRRPLQAQRRVTVDGTALRRVPSDSSTHDQHGTISL